MIGFLNNKDVQTKRENLGKHRGKMGKRHDFPKYINCLLFWWFFLRGFHFWQSVWRLI